MSKLTVAKMACFAFVFCAATAIATPAQTTAVAPTGTFTSLFSFDRTDGTLPSTGLVQGVDGKFYGTTSDGGANQNGTIFSITAGGALTTLHSFDYTNGFLPNGLVQGINGGLYGTTYAGGANQGGEVFKITLSGAVTILYSFCPQGDCSDGAFPSGTLVQAIDGDFYGTTSNGGTSNCFSLGCGTIFKITPSGTLTMLHNFDGTDGFGPEGLVQGTDGNFYGTTHAGGTNSKGNGTVYSFAVGLGPFVETNPAAAKVGATVAILGTSLTGASSVTFNGTAATFTVKSKSEITTTVPSGTTSGTVQVVTPGGTLSSNVPFQVLP